MKSGAPSTCAIEDQSGPLPEGNNEQDWKEPSALRSFGPTGSSLLAFMMEALDTLADFAVDSPGSGRF
jgi:hypothetical protein